MLSGVVSRKDIIKKTDCFKFARYMNHFQLPDDFAVVSLDVVSLFTNILVELCKDNIEKKQEDIALACNTLSNLLG